MSEHRDLLLDSVGRMLGERCGPEVVAAAEAGWPAELWALLEQAGLPLAPVAEAAGGGGAGVADTVAVARLAAQHAAPVPLGETGLLAGHALATAGLPVPAGPLAAVWTGVSARRTRDGLYLTGRASRVPWGSLATRIAVLADSSDGIEVCAVDPGTCAVEHGTNLAGEPRDAVCFDGVEVDPQDCAPASRQPSPSQLEHRAALLRAAQIAGALAGALELSVAYAGDRVQFGRPIGRFQAVGQQLALLAAEAAAAGGAVDLALAALEAGGDARNEIAAAKVRAGRAAGVGSEIAHQVHGAIGFTREHRLHHLTRRLWSWREEHGSDIVWAARLGRIALRGGGSGLWPLITATRLYGAGDGVVPADDANDR